MKDESHIKELEFWASLAADSAARTHSNLVDTRSRLKNAVDILESVSGDSAPMTDETRARVSAILRTHDSMGKEQDKIDEYLVALREFVPIRGTQGVADELL